MEKFYQKYFFIFAVYILMQVFETAIIRSSHERKKSKAHHITDKKFKIRKLQAKNFRPKHYSSHQKHVISRRLSQKTPPDRKLNGPLDAMLSGMTSGIMGGLSVAPPPTPQEILPPKSIIVAPLLVRARPKRMKMAVIRSGSFSPPMGFSPEAMARYSFNQQQMNGRRLNPGMFPPPFSMLGGNPNQISKSMQNYMQSATSNVLNALQASGQARSLHPGQTIDFTAGDVRVPSLTNKFLISGEKTVSETLPSDSEQLEHNLIQSQIISNDNLMEHFSTLNDKVKELTDNYEGLKGDITKYMNEINNLIERAQDQSDRLK